MDTKSQEKKPRSLKLLILVAGAIIIILLSGILYYSNTKMLKKAQVELNDRLAILKNQGSIHEFKKFKCKGFFNYSCKSTRIVTKYFILDEAEIKTNEIGKNTLDLYIRSYIREYGNKKITQNSLADYWISVAKNIWPDAFACHIKLDNSDKSSSISCDLKNANLSTNISLNGNLINKDDSLFTLAKSFDASKVSLKDINLNINLNSSKNLKNNILKDFTPKGYKKEDASSANKAVLLPISMSLAGIDAKEENKIKSIEAISKALDMLHSNKPYSLSFSSSTNPESKDVEYSSYDLRLLVPILLDKNHKVSLKEDNLQDSKKDVNSNKKEDSTK